MTWIRRIGILRPCIGCVSRRYGLQISQTSSSPLRFSSAYFSTSIISRITSRRHIPSAIIHPRTVRYASSKQQSDANNSSNNSQSQEKTVRKEEESEPATKQQTIAQEFGMSDRAIQATKIDLSAQLVTKDDKQNSGWKELKRLFSLASQEKMPFIGAISLLFLSSAVTLSVPYAVGKILDASTASIPSTIMGFGMNQFLFGFAGLMLLGAGANYGRVVLMRVIGERIVARLRAKLYRQTLSQDAEFFDANKVGDLISRLSNDASIIGRSLTQNVSDGLRAIVSGIAGLTMMGIVSLKLTMVMLAIVPPVAVGAFFYGRKIRNIAKQAQVVLGSLTKVSEERLSNVKTIQTFVGEQSEVHRYNTQVRKIFNIGKQEAKLSAIFFGATGFSGNLTILAILAIGSQMVANGSISIGELGSFMMYAAYAGGSMFGLSAFYSELMKGVGAASRLFELQDRHPQISPVKGRKMLSAQGPIQFNHVTFSYPTRPGIEIFKDLTFTVSPGKNVCIVGPSGGGKSTVSSLLLRFYEPSGGNITINGQDIKSFNVKSLRHRIGTVFQEPVLFSGTIAENIAYGTHGVTRYQIVEAARRANCKFIVDFPEGLDTNVGSRGAQLSGGQKQRIAIARALVRNPDILILDEATSALDSESEAAVNDALTKISKENLTTISIAHRLSTIQRCDYIIVVKDGKVAEMGTFQQLSAPNTVFSQLLLEKTENLDYSDVPETEQERNMSKDLDLEQVTLEQDADEDDQNRHTRERHSFP